MFLWNITSFFRNKNVGEAYIMNDRASMESVYSTKTLFPFVQCSELSIYIHYLNTCAPIRVHLNTSRQHNHTDTHHQHTTQSHWHTHKIISYQFLPCHRVLFHHYEETVRGEVWCQKGSTSPSQNISQNNQRRRIQNRCSGMSNERHQGTANNVFDAYRCKDWTSPVCLLAWEWRLANHRQYRRLYKGMLVGLRRQHHLHIQDVCSNESRKVREVRETL